MDNRENYVESDELSFEDLQKVSNYGESVPREYIEDKAIEAGEKIFRQEQLDELRRQRELLTQEQTYSNSGRSHR